MRPPRLPLPRQEWLIPELISDQRLEEIIAWQERNRHSQWYGEAVYYIEDLLCDHAARVLKVSRQP